jgi:hypothetical protein
LAVPADERRRLDHGHGLPRCSGLVAVACTHAWSRAPTLRYNAAMATARCCCVSCMVGPIIGTLGFFGDLMRSGARFKRPASHRTPAHTAQQESLKRRGKNKRLFTGIPESAPRRGPSGGAGYCGKAGSEGSDDRHTA